MKHGRIWKYLAAIPFLFLFVNIGKTYAIYQAEPHYYAPSYFGAVLEQDNLEITHNYASAKIDTLKNASGTFTHEMELKGSATSLDYYFYADFVSGQGLSGLPTLSFVGEAPLSYQTEIVGEGVCTLGNDDFLKPEISRIEAAFQSHRTELESFTNLYYYRYLLDGYDASVSVEGNSCVFSCYEGETWTFIDDHLPTYTFSGGIYARSSPKTLEFFTLGNMLVQTGEYNGAHVTLEERREATMGEVYTHLATNRSLDVATVKDVLAARLDRKFLNLNSRFHESGTEESLYLCRAHLDGLSLGEGKVLQATRTGRARCDYTLIAFFAGGTNYPAYHFTLRSYKGKPASLSVQFESYAPYGNIGEIRYSQGYEAVLGTDYAFEIINAVNPGLVFDSCPQSSGSSRSLGLGLVKDISLLLLTFAIPVVYPLTLILGIQEANMLLIVGSSIIFGVALIVFLSVLLPMILRRHRRKQQK